MGWLKMDNRNFHNQIKELTAKLKTLEEDPIWQWLVTLELSSTSETTLLKGKIKQLEKKLT